MNDVANNFLMSLDKETLAAMNCNQKCMIEELQARNKELEEQYSKAYGLIFSENILLKAKNDCIINRLESLLGIDNNGYGIDPRSIENIITKYRG